MRPAVFNGPPAVLPCLLLAFVTAVACDERQATAPATRVELREGWQIVAAAAVEATPEAISSPGLDTSSWTSTSVPTTVLAALVRSGEVVDPYLGRNLETISTKPFAGPWWYRTEIELDERPGPGARLVFAGINYSADVWLNGRKLADRVELVGAFRMFDLDVSGRLVAGKNALAVLVYPPQPGDPTIGFVDWNPKPPDRSMGLWRGVTLRLTGGVALDEVFVRTDLDLETLDRASLVVRATLSNHSAESLEAVVRGTIGQAIDLERTETLAPGESRDIELSPRDFPQLVIDHPRLWWPNLLGEPNLYQLDLEVKTNGRVSDSRAVTFGIRHVADYLTAEGYRGYAVNGKKILIRGGGWTDDLMLADDPRKIEDQIRYVRHMNLNAIRLEGFWGSGEELYDFADRYGILVIAGWSCQWEWENMLGGPVDRFGGIDTDDEMSLISRSLRDQVLWLRNHPSVLVWVLGSDLLPRPELERRYRGELAEVDPTRPALVSCARGVSEVSGPSGVKMNGPYDWVPPNYWYLDNERGGAYGFNTETGPGPQPPPVDSIRRMLPPESWWPIDAAWEYRCGRGRFRTLDRYRTALDARYGESLDLEDFARKAQVANYEGMRAMFEAFSIRRPATTGIIQWMLNSAWPEMYWQLYDHDLVPNGAFYGARDASRPVNIAYDYADRGIVVVNDTDQPLGSVTARVRVFDLRSRLVAETAETVTVEAGAIVRALTLPEIPELEGNAYFIDARLLGAEGAELVSSLYWLSTQPDVLDWKASEWWVTPAARHADLTGLAHLPQVELEVDHDLRATDDGWILEVSLENSSDGIAFFVELSVAGAQSGRLAAPVLWSDNYLSLLPGERRQVRAEIPAHALRREEPRFRYSGINVRGSAPGMVDARR